MGDVPASFDLDTVSGRVRFAPAGVSPSAQAALTPLTATSPAAASTVAGPALTGAGLWNNLLVLADLTGATGGTLDVYLQHSPDGGTTWYDLVHWPQKAAAAALTTLAITLCRYNVPTAPIAIGKGTTPALAVNTVATGGWGDQLRLLFVAGASTTAGAVQTVKCYGST